MLKEVLKRVKGRLKHRLTPCSKETFNGNAMISDFESALPAGSGKWADT
jgi:hypothetical protein